MKDKGLSFEDLEGKVSNVFVLINLVIKRAKELSSGVPKLVETESNNLFQIALEEIMQGRIQIIEKKKEPEEEKKKG